MDEPKTVSDSLLDIYNKQMKDVSEMRTSLLTLSSKDLTSAQRAIRNITVLRLYHQLGRIVKYTEMMDKLEDRLYESIDMTLDSMDTCDETTWMKLVALQEKLQRNMIESHKLLEPYLDFKELQSMQVALEENDPNDSFTNMILDQQSREKIRSNAQELLTMLKKIDEEGESSDDSSSSDNSN